MCHKVDEYSELVKILLIIEPPCINSSIYAEITNPDLFQKFDFILTHQDSLLSIDPRFRKYNFGGCWIKPDERDIYIKSKNISIIASDKKDSQGHKLRHEVIRNFVPGTNTFDPKIDGVFGRGYNYVKNKIDALKDFKYSIVIENEISDDWFTEKIIDCFVTGTIPIYWGTRNIYKYFNTDGILKFNTIHELEKVLLSANSTLYNMNMPAIRENFELAQKYVLPEDLIYTTFLESIYKVSTI